jgi:hypothetical protein
MQSPTSTQMSSLDLLVEINDVIITKENSFMDTLSWKVRGGVVKGEYRLKKYF